MAATQRNCNLSGDKLTMPVPIAANGGVGPYEGDLLGFGNPSSPVGGGVSQRMMFGMCQTNYTPPTGIVNPAGVSVQFDGVWFVTAIAEWSKSPADPTAIAPGDPLYADSDGTYDPTTGCYYGFTINVDSVNGHYIGNSLDALAAGTSGTVRLRLKKVG